MVNLQKGQKVDITKGTNIKNIIVGLGWDINKYNGSAFDLDAMVFATDENLKVQKERNFIYFNNLEDEAKSIVHSGDNLTGDGDGDDEQIKISLDKVPQDIQKIEIAVNIFEAKNRGQNFGQIENAYIRILNADTNTELLHFDLGEDFSTETAVVAGQLYRNNGEWKFNAIGSGFNGGLDDLVRNYGLPV